jgi:hypothetical protein
MKMPTGMPKIKQMTTEVKTIDSVCIIMSHKPKIPSKNKKKAYKSPESQFRAFQAAKNTSRQIIHHGSQRKKDSTVSRNAKPPSTKASKTWLKSRSSQLTKRST